MKPTTEADVQRRGQELPPASHSPSVESNLVEIFKQLADPTRLKILLMLTREDELNVTSLCERLEASQPAVSHHLALLRMAGMVQTRRAGKSIFYSIKKDRFHFLVDLVFKAINSDGPTPISFDSFVLTRNDELKTN